MTDDIKQQLSALIDGELDADTRRFLLRRLQHEQDLAGCWERWHLGRDLLRRHPVLPLRADFARRVAMAIAAEPTPARGHGATLLRWTAGAAVAASVALAALLAVPGPTSAPDATAPAIAAVPAAEVVPSGLSERDLRPDLGQVARTVAATQGQPLAPALRADPRIEGYLMRHNAVLLQSGQDSFLPFIHIVSPPRQWSMLPPAAPADPDRGH
jgi:sigma-E factor negative regulatory protein RseA